MSEIAGRCPLCGSRDPRISRVSKHHTVLDVRCLNCGQFAIADVDHSNLQSVSARERARVSAIVRELSDAVAPVLLMIDEESVSIPGYSTLTVSEAQARFPQRVSDRLDRALRSLAGRFITLGAEIELRRDAKNARLFALSDTEANYIIDSLTRAGWIEQKSLSPSVDVIITQAGWDHLAKIETTASRSNPAFVAMWFGQDGTPEDVPFMRMLFMDHLKPAIESAGFGAERVDLVEHNDFIMDKVLGMIRVAPFVVADFTGNRGGVYLEAGFARGLGIPVIHTCRESHFSNAHFDIQQINTIRWTEPTELAERVYNRVMSSLGQGPLAKPRNSADRIT